MDRRIRILLADGNEEFCGRLKQVLEKTGKFVVAGAAADGERACALLQTCHPDILALDLMLPKADGITVLKQARELDPPPLALVMTGFMTEYIGMMAAELGADVNGAKRAGLLHDIGKALTHEIEGSHVNIGVDVARKYKENQNILHAIEAHHGDVEPRTIIACLVQAADAISAARPGARRENVENYIKRLQKLEEIANSFDGVEKCYAIQAGREIRILVKPEVVKDDQTVLVAREIAKKIESELDYPGQVKVHVVRESRAIEYAK